MGSALELVTTYWTQLRQEAEYRLLWAWLRLREHHRAITQLKASLTHDPLREDLWAMLMLAYYRSYRRADALQAYRTAHHWLATELGIAPSPGLATLHQAILRGDQTLNIAGPTDLLDVNQRQQSA